MTHQQWIARCIEQAADNATRGQAPFAALVVKDGTLIGEGVNDVRATHDPTGHAEIRALQAAADNLGSRRLAGCILYTSCEPCPMCLGAIYWSGITRGYFGLSVDDQAAFDDLPQFQFAEFRRSPSERRVQMVQAVPDGMDPRRPFLIG
jgi:guanine deaminase